MDKAPYSRRQAWRERDSSKHVTTSADNKGGNNIGSKDDVDGHNTHGHSHTESRIPQLLPAGAMRPHIERHTNYKPKASLSEIQIVVSKDTPDCTKITENSLPDRIPFSVIDIIFVVVSIILYMVDIGLDCFVAYKHYLTISVNPLYFYFTLAFVVLSALITDIFSLWWYYFEYSVKKKTKQELPSKHWIIIRILGSILLLGPVLRYIDTVRYGLQGRKKHLTSEQRQWYHMQMQYERVDGAMLRLFEAFLEAAPQTLLQLYIILEQGLEGEAEQNHFLMVVTLLSIASSMLSLAWSVVAYHKALRMSRHDRSNISHFGLFLRFMWRLFEINPRILILAMFMSAYQAWLGLFFAIHWVIMFIWIKNLKTSFCEKSSFEHIFVMLTAMIWVFCFFNIKDGHTRKRGLLYYVIYYIENVILTVIWYNSADTIPGMKDWYKPALTAIGLGSVVFMLLFMFLYYKFGHPEEILNCLPVDYWFCCRKNYRNNHRYNSVEGNRSERQVLTDKVSPESHELSTASSHRQGSPDIVGNTEVETRLSSMKPDSSTHTGSTASLNSAGRWLDPDPEHDNDPTTYIDPTLTLSSKPNLDDCVEINGYLELNESRSKPALHRQDTIPKYQAPLPNKHQNNYGATVPGGAPTIFTYNLAASLPAEKGQGSTLPGNTAKPAVVDNRQEFVPYVTLEDQDTSPSLPPRHSALTASQRDSQYKPPMPEPRKSVLLRSQGSGEDNSTRHDDSYLTNVTQITDADEEEDNSQLDDSIIAADAAGEPAATGSLNKTTESVASIDTPLKSSLMSTNGCMSPDTPERELTDQQRRGYI